MSGKLAKIISKGHRALFPTEYYYFNVWGKLSFPHRPTPREIEIYRSFIGRVPSGARFLILGATPELRDLAAEIGARPTLVDISAVMFGGMLKFAKLARPENEVWIKGDWLSMEFPERFFDVVVGDLSLRHIRPDEQEMLLGKISCILKPKGRLILRHHTVNPARRGRPYEEILGEGQGLHFADRKYEAMGVLLSRLFDASTKNLHIDPPEIVCGVESYLRRRRIPFSYAFFLTEFLEQWLINFKKPLLSPTKEEFESPLLKYFTIEDVVCDDSYPESQFYPIYLLVKS